MYVYIHQTNFNVYERCEHQKSHEFFMQIYFGAVFLCQCMCVCEWYGDEITGTKGTKQLQNNQYIYEQETNVCMCSTKTKKKQKQKQKQKRKVRILLIFSYVCQSTTPTIYILLSILLE